MTWYDTFDMKTDSWYPVGHGVAQKSPNGPLFVHVGIKYMGAVVAATVTFKTFNDLFNP